MKMVIAVALILLLSCSTAVAGWGHVVPVATPAAVVHTHYPVMSYPIGPVYGYPAPVIVGRPFVAVPPRVVYRRSYVVAPAPVVVAPRVVYRAPYVVAPPIYAAPVVLRPKVYVLGQPIRNAIRAVTP